ncbi:hypothetical protein BKA69DRAFT_839233 [Paraphysoderma sedebokerense]|nr:hypothetical protein BKA69DRAFT_839233 [Paraphysoderma sedebokerense]
MTGTIPPQLGQLTSLTILHIQRNSISGALPSEIALLTSLNVFAIDNSKITRLPRNFGLLTALDGINCWLEGVYDTCRPNPYPEACLANNVNTYMNSLTPCPLYTVTTNSVSPTNIVSYTSTTIQTTSSIDSFTTRSITVGPTSTETSIQRIQNLNQNQPSVITRQQKYIIFSSLLGVIFTLFILLSILRRRLQSRVKLAQKVDPAPQ